MKNQYAWRSIKGLHRIIISLIVVASALPSLAQKPLNEQEVYERLMSRKDMDGYREGTPWDNSHIYSNTVVFNGSSPGYYGGKGCHAFMIDMMEYASNYEYPIRIVKGSYDNLPKIHVGDGVRVMNDCHSVVVLEKISDHVVIVAEANSTSARVAIGVKKQLEMTGCKILGCVLNKVPSTGTSYRYRYRYYGEYEHKADPESGEKKRVRTNRKKED